MAGKKISATLYARMMDEINSLASSKPVISLRDILRVASKPNAMDLIQAAQSVQHNLPFWIADQVVQLDKVPAGFNQTPAVLKVRQEYLDSFCAIRSFPRIETVEDENKFTRMIEEIQLRINDVIQMTVLGVQQMNPTLGVVRSNAFPTRSNAFPKSHSFLPNLLPLWKSVIGIRFVIEHHVKLHHPSPGWLGCLHFNMSPIEVAQRASEDARTLCLREYGSASNIEFHGRPDFSAEIYDIFPIHSNVFIPSHFYLMIFELVKNSLRAVQERFVYSVAPPIKIIIVPYNAFAAEFKGVTIKVSDEGGGIPSRDFSKVFNSFYTTAKNPVEHPNLGTTAMAGYGYGLPLTRLYAGYFGGDLKLDSMEEYGMDAYIHLHPLEYDEKLFKNTGMGF